MTTKFHLNFLLLLFFGVLICCNSIQAQHLTQTIRGTIIDKDSESSMPGANVILLNTEPLIGTTSDAQGNFKLENVPVGRNGIKITFLGYKDLLIGDLLINSAKEIVITAKMEESFVQTEAVEIVAEVQKDKALNEMSTVSARTFTIEETNRYAGAWGDPSRMVSYFAGVTSGNDQRNDIVVRGNSPIGVLWKLDGMDIPSPNHFSTNGASGGAISILNNNTLENSDFMTGAFAAEYGNAVSGVFDLKLRKGNNEKREYIAQFGANGFELGAEGPFVKKKRSSYLINYRYSALGLLGKMGFFDFVGAVPYYQDISLKTFFPYSKGNFTVFAIGGKSYLTISPDKDTTKWKDDPYLMRERRPESMMGVAGATWTHFLSPKTFIKSGYVSSYSKSIYYEDSTDYNYEKHRLFYTDFVEGSHIGSFTLNSKLNTRNTIRIGASYHSLYFDFLTERTYYQTIDSVFKYVDYKGSSNLLQSFAQWKHKLKENLSLNLGFHYLYYLLNDQNSLEPRAGIKWEFTKRQSISFGFGMHSKLLPAGVYFSSILDGSGGVHYPNKALDFTRATHYVMGYDYLLGPVMRLKMEVYYQELSSAPVRGDTLNHFSGLNTGADYENISTTKALKSDGTGKNYGVELTLERFYSKGYYYLCTGSLFDSKYKGSDGIERNTTFNSNFAFNLLGGKEFKVGKSKNNAIVTSITWVTLGGRREVPILVDSSRAIGSAVYDYKNAYEKKLASYMRLDGRISFRRNRKKFSDEIALDVRNILNRKNIFLSYYDEKKGDEVFIYQSGFFPVLFYKIEF